MAGGDPWPRRARRTSRSTSTSAPCAPPASGRGPAHDARRPAAREWLLAHGAAAAIAELPRHDAERLWLEALSDPQGSGAAFRVLVQERG